MSYRFRRIQTFVFVAIAIFGIYGVIEQTAEGYRKAGTIEAISGFIGAAIGMPIICIILAVIAHWVIRALDKASHTRNLPRSIIWENKVFPFGARVVINRDDPDYFDNPMVIRAEDSPHSAEIDCDNGKTGVVIGGNSFGSLAVRWDAQQWREHKTRREISLPSFETSIHPDHMDLVSSITANNPLKTQNRTPPGADRPIDLSNKDWLQDLANNTPMRDLVELPHEVLTNDYFIGLLDNASVSAMGRAHHQLPRPVIQKIATQLLRRAEQDRSLAHFLEISKTAEPPWTFDWEKAARG